MGRQTVRVPTCESELALGWPELAVAGVDEVGRGCLVGPVVAAAVVLPASVLSGAAGGALASPWAEIRDSKLLTAHERTELAAWIRAQAPAWCVAEASAAEIDQVNILRATHLAMLRAIAGVQRSLALDSVLIDGNSVPRELANAGKPRALTLVGGDARSVSIASASILAKVARDAWCEGIEGESGPLGIATHKGYPTPAHLAALARAAADPSGVGDRLVSEYRYSFSPVRRLLGVRAQRLLTPPRVPTEPAIGAGPDSPPV